MITALFRVILASPIAHASTGFLSLSGFAQPQGLGALLSPDQYGLASALVATAGFFDGISICSLTLIILLLGHLLAFTKSRREAIKMGLIYTVTIFAVYVLVGVALSQFLSRLILLPQYGEIRLYVNYFFIFLLLAAGLINLQDFFFAKRFVFGITKDETHWFKKHLKKITYGWTVILGCVAVIFMIPCSLPIYLSTVGILSQLPNLHLYWHIILYSFMFVAPLLIVLAISVRFEWFIRHKDISSEKYRSIKLIKALVQLALAGLLAFL